jgi:hypothetical protein
MKTCDWLVVMVIHDFKHPDYEPIIDSIIREFESEGAAASNEMLLVHDEIYETDSGEIKFKTSFRRLAKKSESPPPYSFEDIEDIEVGFDFHDGRTWEELFKWINDSYSSKSTALITLSDGAGFGLLDDVNDDQTLDVKQSDKRYIPKNFLTPEFHQKIKTGICPSEKIKLYRNNIVYTDKNDNHCNALDMLWVGELASALENGFAGRKLDILMMANCYMQTFESGWLLRKKVKYLVAPETIFKAFGYAFDKLMRLINTRPGIKPNELVKTIKNDFIAKWKKPDIEPKHLKMVSISVNDLGYYGILKFFFEIIAKLLMWTSDTQFLKLIELRQKFVANATSTPLPGPGRPSDAIRIQMVDINHLFNTIKKLYPYNILLRSGIYIFRQISRLAVRDIYIGDDYPEHDRIKPKKFRLSGISIYLPNNLVTARNAEISNCAYFGTTQILFSVLGDIPLENFTKTSSWDEFVERYIKLLAATNPNNQTGQSAINAQP